MSSYVLSTDADLDLDDIWEYIAGDNIEAADHWISELFDAFEALGQNPRMGHLRTDHSISDALLGSRGTSHYLPG